MSEINWAQRIRLHKEMLVAIENGTATPEQQKAAYAHIRALKGQANEDARDSQRDARDAYSQGREDAARESEGFY
jgi:ribosome-binding protein aMBF1 (putative translation factor)